MLPKILRRLFSNDGVGPTLLGSIIPFGTDAPKAHGTAAVGTSETAARNDHVHPAQTTVSGNAGTATKLATARSLYVALGTAYDSASPVTFDGSAAKALPVSGTLPIARGGTGLTANPSMLVNLASTTADAVLEASPRPGVTGTLPIANGGTGNTTGLAAAATKLNTARTIDGVDFNGTAAITHYGSCSTEAATVEKTVALTGFKLVTGARVTVRFTVTNTAASPTLNVNSTGAKAIQYRNAAITAGYLAANRVYEFVYDGSAYELVGDINTDANTTYSAMTGATSSAAGKAGLVPAPAAGKQASFLRGDGTWVVPTNTTYSNMTAATADAAGKAGLVPAPGAGKQASFLRGDGTWQIPVTLNNTVTSTSTTQAATANAVKTVNDKITAMNGYITATWKSGASWYRKWSDGWIEQGGEISAGGTQTITFPTPFTTTNYFFMANYHNTSSDSSVNINNFSTQSPTTTSCKIRISSSTNFNRRWYACGY